MKVRSDRMRERSGIAGGVIDFSFVRYLLNCVIRNEKGILRNCSGGKKKRKKKENEKGREGIRFRSGQKSS